MKLIVLTGIPGSGSTTVLNKVLEQSNFLHLNYGDIMTEIAIEEDVAKDRDELRKLSPAIQRSIQKKAARRIKEKSTSEDVIVDTHCTIQTPSGFLPGLPVWVLDELLPTAFIVIEANADEIIFRRLTDSTRSRDTELAKNIELHQEMNRAASMTYATLTGATVKIFENRDKHLEHTVSKIVEFLRL